MSNRTISPVAKRLIDARALIQNEDNWCPEGTGANGIQLRTDENKPPRLCAMQALTSLAASSLYYSRDWLHDAAVIALTAAAWSIHSAGGVVATNRLGHASVMKMYDLAITNELQKTATGAS